MRNITRFVVLIALTMAVLSLIYVPAFPVQDTFVTGQQAWLVCAAIGMPCPSNPQFIVHNPGYASATYLLFRFGTRPQLHYPIRITVYLTNSSTSVTRPVNVILRDESTACTENNSDQPTRCVAT